MSWLYIATSRDLCFTEFENSANVFIHMDNYCIFRWIFAIVRKNFVFFIFLGGETEHFWPTFQFSCAKCFLAPKVLFEHIRDILLKNTCFLSTFVNFSSKICAFCEKIFIYHSKNFLCEKALSWILAQKYVLFLPNVLFFLKIRAFFFPNVLFEHIC